MGPVEECTWLPWDGEELLAVSLCSGLRNTALLNPRGRGTFEMQMFWLLQVLRSRTRSCFSSSVYCSFPSGYDALGYSVKTGDKWSGRQLLQAHEQNVTDVPEGGGQVYVRNCTEPGRSESCLQLPSPAVGFLTSVLPRCTYFKSINAAFHSRAWISFPQVLGRVFLCFTGLM